MWIEWENNLAVQQYEGTPLAITQDLLHSFISQLIGKLKIWKKWKTLGKIAIYLEIAHAKV
jgi:hypothetical protein